MRQLADDSLLVDHRHWVGFPDRISHFFVNNFLKQHKNAL